MMHFNIVCVGKIKEAYLQSAIADYVTRLSKYVKIAVFLRKNRLFCVFPEP